MVHLRTAVGIFAEVGAGPGQALMCLHALVRVSGRIAVEPGVEIAYAERGSGAPVVLVPGWTMSMEVFEHQVATLSPRFRVIALDPRSHGRSTPALTGQSYPQQGRDLAAIITALDLHGVHLVAWSYGALAVYSYIEETGPERLRSCTAIDQPPKPLRTGEPNEWAEETVDVFLDEFIGPLLADPTGFADSFVGCGSWTVTPNQPSGTGWRGCI